MDPLSGAHFDVSLAKHVDKERLNTMLNYMLSGYEQEYDCRIADSDTNVRLTNLIKCVSEQADRQVVVLIDEYDAPLLDVMYEEKNLPVLRDVMRNFYSRLKACYSGRLYAIELENRLLN